jgi:hypothetical protein
MNPKVLPAEAWAVVKSLGSTDLLNGWILAGGTALALQLGHRVSIDLGFFHHEDFEVTPLRALVQQRFRNTEFNVMHLLCSLVYFDDAETEPMPKMLSKTGWPVIRLRLEREARDWAP